MSTAAILQVDVQQPGCLGLRRERGRIVGNNMTEQHGDDEVLRLFEAALAGDLQAFGDLLQLYRPQLTAFLNQRIGALLRARADASDVVQEIALQGLGGTSSVQFLRSLGPLGCLKRLASHRLAEVCRRTFSERRNPNRERGGDLPGAQTFGLAEWLVDSLPSPSEALQRSEDILLLWEKLNSLEPDDLQLLNWVYFEKRTRREVAELLGIAEDTARQRVRRAVSKLTVLINRRDLGEPPDWKSAGGGAG